MPSITAIPTRLFDDRVSRTNDLTAVEVLSGTGGLRYKVRLPTGEDMYVESGELYLIEVSPSLL